MRSPARGFLAPMYSENLTWPTTRGMAGSRPEASRPASTGWGFWYGKQRPVVFGARRWRLKFTAARGMPIADEASEATDVVVVGGELMFVLPEGVRLSAS